MAVVLSTNSRVLRPLEGGNLKVATGRKCIMPSVSASRRCPHCFKRGLWGGVLVWRCRWQACWLRAIQKMSAKMVFMGVGLGGNS